MAGGEGEMGGADGIGRDEAGGGGQAGGVPAKGAAGIALALQGVAEAEERGGAQGRGRLGLKAAHEGIEKQASIAQVTELLKGLRLVDQAGVSGGGISGAAVEGGGLLPAAQGGEGLALQELQARAGVGGLGEGAQAGGGGGLGLEEAEAGVDGAGTSGGLAAVVQREGEVAEGHRRLEGLTGGLEGVGGLLPEGAGLGEVVGLKGLAGLLVEGGGVGGPGGGGEQGGRDEPQVEEKRREKRAPAERRAERRRHQRGSGQGGRSTCGARLGGTSPVLRGWAISRLRRAGGWLEVAAGDVAGRPRSSSRGEAVGTSPG